MIADSRYLPLKDNSVNCIITSPPYWSLRKYDIPDLVWDEGYYEEIELPSFGNLPAEKTRVKCEHEWGNDLPDRILRGTDTGPRKEVFQDIHLKTGNFCLHCSAWRGQLGLEPTIDLYLKHLMQITDECKRVLRDDGTMWVNIGDSYSGSGKAGNNPEYQERHTEFGKPSTHKQRFGVPTTRCDIPPKSLCLIPERFAIEMVDSRGWILRNKIIWYKPNCMPASVKDRFTVDFEPVFFFVKSKKYWFEQQYDSILYPANGRQFGHTGNNDRNDISRRYTKDNPQGRNRRCVWTISTQPYPESHFATFPEALIEPMIRAGCPKEICVKCGKAREKIIKAEGGTIGRAWNDHKNELSEGQRIDNEAKGGHGYKRIERGYTDCGCNAGFRPGIILDPFCGSGTTMRVAEKLNRIGIGFDLGYQNLQNKRVKNIQKELFT